MKTLRASSSLAERPWAWLTLGVLLAVAWPARAAADDSPAATARVDEAGTRFRRGVELYNEGDLGAALIEFSRAYELAPRYKILFNLAQIAYQQQDYVAALRHFRRYLADGGDDVPTSRRAYVQQEIRKLEPRVARIDVRAPAGARILIDGVERGVAPLDAPVEASVGRRHVEAVLPGGDRRDRFVDLAGGDLVVVALAAATGKTRAAPEPAGTEDAPLPMAASAEPVAEVPGPTARRGLWLPWTATAVLAAGAGVAGVFALTSARDLQNARQSYPASSDELGRLHDRTRALSLVADGAAAGAVIIGAVSIYLTVRSPTGAPPPARPSVHLSLLPSDRGGLAVTGIF